MKIAFFEGEKWERTHFKKSSLGKEHSLFFYHDPLTSENIPSDSTDAEILSVFIYSKVDKKVLDKFPRLKMIATRSTGFDHIDLKECRHRGIPVSNVPYYGENTVAEHTFALILSLSRKVHQAYIKTTSADFTIQGLQGFDLKGKTLGIVGAGKIGLHVIKIARGFGMNVLAYDPNRNSFLEEIMEFKYTDLANLLKNSDIISVHTPHNKYTHHIINMENIKTIKKGALLINTARGACVDTNSIIYGLDNHILAGAGLDAFEGEDLIKEDQALLYNDLSKNNLKTILQNNILLRNEKVVITPHIAFNSKEAIMRILDTTIANIHKFIAGTPINVVKLKV